MEPISDFLLNPIFLCLGSRNKRRNATSNVNTTVRNVTRMRTKYDVESYALKTQKQKRCCAMFMEVNIALRGGAHFLIAYHKNSQAGGGRNILDIYWRYLNFERVFHCM